MKTSWRKRPGSFSTSLCVFRKIPPLFRNAFFVLAILALGSTSAEASGGPANEAIRTVQKLATGCEKCVFFALPTKSPLIKQHALYVVSTLDRLPPPFWTIALPKKGDPLVLDGRKTEDWNRMIVSEKVALKLDSDVETYVRAYLDLAVGRAVFVPKLLPGELEEVQKKGDRPPASPLQIHRDDDLVSVAFYARDVTGKLQRWSILVQSDGTIIKTDVK
jgi:hypothetical protein